MVAATDVAVVDSPAAGRRRRHGRLILAWIAWLAVVVSLQLSAAAGTAAPTPPPVKVNPDLVTIHHCGLDPDNADTFPYIPPLDDPDYELAAVYGFLRHGHRFFATDRPCWAGQENLVYACNLTELDVPIIAVGDNDPVVKLSPLFRTRFLDRRDSSGFKGSCAISQLTDKGYEQAKIVGKLFRHAYVRHDRLLHHHPAPDQVFIRATDSSRAVATAQAFLTGMFPDRRREEDGPYRPRVFDIWTLGANHETMLPNAAICPALNDVFVKSRQTPSYRQHFANITTPLLQRFAQITDTAVMNVTDTQLDGLYVAACGQTPIPTAVTKEFMRQLESDGVFRFYSLMQFPDRMNGSRLAAGPLLAELLRHLDEVMQARLDDLPHVKFRMYSGHDIGPIMILLSALSVEDRFWPSYASYISLELYQCKITETYAVRMVYNGEPLRLPGQHGRDLLPLAAFRALLLPVIPSAKECPGAVDTEYLAMAV